MKPIKKIGKKTDFPVGQIRRFLEPGPVVLVSSAYRGERNIMTMGWHLVMAFSPSLIGCVISSAEHSFDLVRKSKECVINIPTVDLAERVVGVGNTSGLEVDKFEKFAFTTDLATEVGAPLIRECFVNLECKLVDASMVKKYSFFVFEVVKAHAASQPKYPKTIHYRGDGHFMISGDSLNLRRKFKASMLDT